MAVFNPPDDTPGNSAGVRGLHQGKLHANAKAHDTPGILILDRYDGSGSLVSYYLWVDSTGDLRIHTSAPSNQDSDGSVVGTQS